MAALHVVARPRPNSPASESVTSSPLSVRGKNLTARVVPDRVADFLADVGYALVSAVKQPRGAASVSLQAEDEPWELGLQRRGADILLTEFVGGPTPRVEWFEHSVPFEELRTGLVKAFDHAIESESTISAQTRSTLKTARARLMDLAPPEAESQAPTQVVSSQRKTTHFGLCVESKMRAYPAVRREAPSLERADVFSLLLVGSLQIRCASCVLEIADSQVFLDLERLLGVVEDLLRASRAGQPIFRRIQLSNARVTARRGPGSAPVEIGFALKTARATGRSALAGEVNTETLAKTVARVCADFCQAMGKVDAEQERNLRLVSLARRARELLDDLTSSSVDADLTNPEPDSYKRFAPRLKRNRVSPSTTSAMRFLPRWVATMPGLDLSGTFLCGDRLMVGGLRETACLDRRSGEILWKRPLRAAACVVTPSGLVRVEPDGKLSCHSLETGEVRFTCKVTPRSSGGTSGSVLYGGGLPKLLALAEGDRQVSGIDLTTGEVKWRYTGPRSAAFKLRRAGKLLIVAGGDNRIVGLDGATGQLVWSFSAKSPFTGDITFDHDAAFALSGAPGSPYSLHRFNPWSGQPEWSFELEERPRAPLLCESTVVLPTSDADGHGVVAYDRNTGARAWQHAPGLLSAQAAWLAVDDTVVANSASGVLLGLDARTGQVRYNHVFSHASDGETPRRLEPVLRSGALFVPQHEVVVLRPSDGEMLGRVSCDLVPDLVRVDERCDVYIAEESGHLAAFGAGARLSVIRR